MIAALVVALSGAVLALLPAAPAAALSCVGPDRVLRDAGTVFVGRVVDTRGGRLLVEVDETWWGRPVAGRVWLAVDLPGWSSWADGGGEIPDGRSFPERWLFAPELDGAAASVNPCTAWPLAGAELAGHRPEKVRPPDDAEGFRGVAPAVEDGASLTPWAVVAGAGVAAAVLLVLRARRRGRAGPARSA